MAPTPRRIGRPNQGRVHLPTREVDYFGRTPPSFPFKGLLPFISTPSRMGFSERLRPAHQEMVNLLSQPIRLLGRHTPPGGPLVPSPQSRYTTDEPETFPVTKTGLPIYQSLSPNHSGAPRDVRDLIRDSKQLSATNTYNSTISKRHRTLSVQTLRVRELWRHDLRHSSVNIQ